MVISACPAAFPFTGTGRPAERSGPGKGCGRRAGGRGAVKSLQETQAETAEQARANFRKIQRGY